MIGSEHSKKIILVSGFGWVIRFADLFTCLVNKAFGNLVYERGIGKYKQEYRLFSLEDNIREAEKNG